MVENLIQSACEKKGHPGRSTIDRIIPNKVGRNKVDTISFCKVVDSISFCFPVFFVRVSVLHTKTCDKIYSISRHIQNMAFVTQDSNLSANGNINFISKFRPTDEIMNQDKNDGFTQNDIEQSEKEKQKDTNRGVGTSANNKKGKLEKLDQKFPAKVLDNMEVSHSAQAI